MKTRGLWIIAIAVAIAVPWLFYNWETHRHSGFVISMLSQMGMMIVLSLSYNMLLGQAGLFSLCHATFFGFGGYATIHLLTAIGKDEWPVPMEIVPLASGLAGGALAVLFGYMATKQRATAFAMITMGIGELGTVSALMFHHFYGGEGGVSTDRMIDNSLLGLTYASGIQVYYLILGWTLLAAGMMLFLTHTPLGRMANATRDNFERAQFMGYDPRMVRFMQFALAGFFAGIGGGLYAITYEIVTFDALAGPLSANALLMAYIGGTGVFAGPILGAILNTVLQSWDSLLSNSWLIYVGVMFIAMVIFAPEGLAGIVLAHKPLQQRGRLGQLIVPYLRLMPAGLAVAFGFVGLVELMSFLTIGLAQGKKLTIGGNEINVFSATPWAIAIACLVIGGLWLRFEAASFRRLWDQITAELKTGAARV